VFFFFFSHINFNLFQTPVDRNNTIEVASVSNGLWNVRKQ